MSADRPLKVLLVVEAWQVGGTENYVDSLCDWLKYSTNYHISVCVLGTAQEEIITTLTNIVDEVVVIRDGGRWIKFISLTNLLRRTKPKICHLHLYSSLLPALLAARLISRAKVLVTLHMPSWHWNFRHRIGWRIALALSHFVMGNSSATLRSVGRWPADDRTALIPPPLPVSLLNSKSVSDAERPRDTSLCRFRIGGAGRLAPEKCWADLLRAFAQLTNEADVSYELCLYGDGPEWEALQILARELGIQAQVRFNNFLPQRELHRVISDCDVFVLPSRFEGLGMVAIEAMALGVPTITADFEASVDFIEQGVTGCTFPHGNINALLELLRWHRDHPHEAAVIGRRGQIFVRERFHPDITFKLIPDIYNLWESKPHKMLML